MSVLGQSFGETNTGRKRRRNEDTFVCEPPLFAVADGMGGAQAGEVASAIAATALSGALAQGENVAAPETERLVARLVREANRRVHDRAEHDPNVSGMGTTMTVALVGSDGLVAIGHVGDSRAYLLRDGSLEQLTDDHSLVAELVRRGELSPAEAEVHPQRSVITRALGTDPDVDVDTLSVEARPGDVFLLCSDGLSTMVDTDTISELVARNRNDLESATRALIKAANDEGGEDNITAVLFAIDGAPATNGAPEAVTTVVAAEPEPAADDADADTLHPEDGVPVVAAAAAADPEPETMPEGTETGDTMVIPAAAFAAAAAEPSAEPGPADDETAVEGDGEAEAEEPFPVARMILATLLIIALAAIAVALVLWGLAR